MPRVWKIGSWPGIGEWDNATTREEYIRKALGERFVAVGGAKIPNLAGRSIDWIKERISTPQKAWEWYRFANEIRQGHLILLYVATRSTQIERTFAYLGRIKEPPKDLREPNARSDDAYYYVPRGHPLARYFKGPDYAPHRINVAWQPPKEGFHVSIPRWQDTVHEITEEDIGTNLVALDDKLKSILRKFLANNPDKTGPYIKTGEKQSWSTHRIGQGKVRERALERYEERCALCPINLPSLLVAGHIQGWAKNETARNQDDNIILMCGLHDSLFGRGFFRIEPNSLHVIYSPQLRPYREARLRISRITESHLRQPKPASGSPSKQYLDWHRKNIFLQDEDFAR